MKKLELYCPNHYFRTATTFMKKHSDNLINMLLNCYIQQLVTKFPDWTGPFRKINSKGIELIRQKYEPTIVKNIANCQRFIADNRNSTVALFWFSGLVRYFIADIRI